MLTLPEYTPLASFFRLPILIMRAAALPLALALLFTFPDGRFSPAWSRWLVAGYSLLTLIYLLFPTFPTNTIYGPTWRATIELSLITSSAPFIIGIYAQFRRYRQTAPARRNQIKWTALGMAIMVVGIMLYYGVYALLQAQTHSTPITTAELITATTLEALRQFIQLVLAVILPSLCFMIAIFRYRLWTADTVINRVLVYTTFLGILSLTYVVAILLIGMIFNTINFFASIPVTLGIVLIFQPLRTRIQATVNHLMFGERDNPYAVLSKVSTEVQDSTTHTALPNIGETLAHALNLSYVAIFIDGKPQTSLVIGNYRESMRLSRFPMVYVNVVLGEIVVGQDWGDRLIRAEEQHLIENIARQTGIVVHAMQLNSALQQSRQQIITAREEERRRLRRDLHDGLGPTLASHSLKVGKARALLTHQPDMAARVLHDLEADLNVSLADLRRLVYDLRPPVLDQLGLIGALHTFIESLEGADTSRDAIRFEMCFPDKITVLSAAVEVAAYRIVTEAVTNVVRHADASQCRVMLEIDGWLTLIVSDNGSGLPHEMQLGVGLQAIRERAEELGGSMQMDAVVPHGVCMTARLPVR